MLLSNIRSAREAIGSGDPFATVEFAAVLRTLYIHTRHEREKSAFFDELALLQSRTAVSNRDAAGKFNRGQIARDWGAAMASVYGADSAGWRAPVRWPLLPLRTEQRYELEDEKRKVEFGETFT